MQTKIRSQFKVALLQQPRTVRQMKAEDFYDKEDEPVDTDDTLTLECAKVAVSVNDNITKEVKSTVKDVPKKSRRTTKKKSSILAHGPPLGSAVRRSTRKRAAPSWLAETPLASSTLTAAALGGFSTAKTTRAPRGRAAGPSAIFGQTPLITPKFDMATPLNRTVTRVAKADEKFLVSLNGSPVYVGGRGARAKNENLIPVPIGDGKTLMVPADNPDVQPMIQNLISTCMNLMSKK